MCKDYDCTEVFKNLPTPTVESQLVTWSIPSNRSIIVNDTDDQSELSTNSSLQSYELLTSNESSNHSPYIPNIAITIGIIITCRL